MIGSVLLAAVLSLPAAAQAVRVGADSWVVGVDPARVEEPQRGERLWWWSADCAPARITSEIPRADCRAATPQAIRILDERGKKVIGAKIVWGSAEMLSDIPETMLPVATSDEDGVARLMTGAQDVILVRAAGPRLASWWQKVGLSRTAASIRVSEAVIVSTTLQLAAGKATRSIVELDPVSIVATDEGIRSWAAAERDAVAFLPMPRMAVRYEAWCDDCAPRTGVFTTQAFPRAIPLPPGARVEGRVVTGKRVALGDTQLEAVFKLADAALGLRRRARTDANGRFVIRGLAPGPVQMLVRKPGYASALRMLQVEAVLSVGEIVLKPARTVALRVIDSAGRPVPLADVRTPDGVRTTTNAKGLATLDGIPAGEEVQIDARARGFRNGKLTAVADKQAFELVLSRGVHVLASVIRAGTREPAGPGTVMIGNNGGRRIEQFDSSGLIDLGGLDAGTLIMEIRAAGATPLVLPERTARVDEEIDLGELQLPAGAAMTGRVLSRTDSAPIANARVKVLRRGPADRVVRHARLGGDDFGR